MTRTVCFWMTLANLGVAANLPDALPPFPWRLAAPLRFVWVQGKTKVGETQVKFEPGNKAPAASAAFMATTERKYDREGISQRSTGSTWFLRDGTPLRFEERLDVSGLDGKKWQQEATFEFAAGKVKTRYVQSKVEQPVRELSLPQGTFLIASQAVEHWLIFAATFAPGCESRQVKLFYPDFGEVLQVTFKKAGSEPLKVGDAAVETTKYTFRDPGGRLQGTVWLDRTSRLLQVEFPNAASQDMTLRVTFTGEEKK